MLDAVRPPRLSTSVRLNMNKLVALAILLLAAGPSWASEVFTGENLNQPFRVHGRLSVYNGSANLRIWIVGSNEFIRRNAESDLASPEWAMGLHDRGECALKLPTGCVLSA